MSTFESDPRAYALELVESGLVDEDYLLLCCLKYMSHHDVRQMLDANELSPRFDDDDEYEMEDEDAARESFWDEHPEFEDEYDEGKSHNDYSAEIRTAFSQWLDGACRDGRLSDELAFEVTL